MSVQTEDTENYVKQLLDYLFPSEWVTKALAAPAIWDSSYSEFSKANFSNDKGLNDAVVFAIKTVEESLNQLSYESLSGKIKAIEKSNSMSDSFWPVFLAPGDLISELRIETPELETALSLSLGLAPCRSMYSMSHIEWGSISHIPANYLLSEFYERSQLIRDTGLETWKSIKRTVSLFEVFQYFLKYEMEVPDALCEPLFRYNGLTYKKRGGSQPTNESPLSRSSMLKLIYVMAKTKFEFDENINLGRPKYLIELAALDQEIEISKKTIGKYLKLSAEEAQKQRDKKV